MTSDVDETKREGTPRWCLPLLSLMPFIDTKTIDSFRPVSRSTRRSRDLAFPRSPSPPERSSGGSSLGRDGVYSARWYHSVNWKDMESKERTFCLH